MRKLVNHPSTKPVITGLLQLAIFLAWGCGGLKWFLPRYIDWVELQLHVLPMLIALPMTLAFGLLGASIVLGTLYFPDMAVRRAEQAMHWFNGRGRRA